MKKFTQTDGMSYAEKIEFFANSSNCISINNGNRKTGKACLTLSLPAGVTCRPDVPCKKICYAMKGKMTFPNVCGAYHRNYRIWNEDPIRFETQLDAFITFSGLPLLRIFDTGDLPSIDFFCMLIRIAKLHSDVKMLMFTKRYEWINEWLTVNVLPENLVVRFSMWDKSWYVPNPYDVPTAYVDFANSELNPEIPENAFLCHGDKDGVTCSSCRACFNPNIKIVKFIQH